MKPPTNLFRSKGFTLIELLIVVAIIAILAAIAVPNFLEAQTRSKVSRVKSDMRSTATALEAYFVDNNKYPPDFTHRLRNPPRYLTLVGRLSHLTTPISYITSLPVDIFAENVAAGSARTYGGAPLSSEPYRENASPSGAIIRPITYDYATMDRYLPAPYVNDLISVWSQITSSPESVHWALNSPGPDITAHAYLGNSTLVIYDPSNGTISLGQVIRTNVSAEDSPLQ